MEKGYLLFLVCLLKFVWSDVIASLLEGFLGIAMESGAGLTAFKACELLSRYIAVCSGAMTLMRKEDCPRKISDEQVFVVLLLGVYK